MKHKLPKLLLIDAYNLAYRSFYALPQSLETSYNLPVNALYGFLKSFISMYRELNPEYLAVCLDGPGKTFRALADSTYKAQRKETPEALIVQLKQLSEVFLPTLKIPFFSKDTFEADDIIASLSTHFAQFCEVYIASNDKDLFQLLQEDRIHIILPGKTYQDLRIYTEKDFIAEYGIPTHQFGLFKALTGDSSDNLKGIKGIGPKTALKLIHRLETPEAMLTDNSKLSEPIRQEKNEFLHFLHMVHLVSDLDLGLKLEDLAFSGIGNEEIQELSRIYEFHSLSRSYKASNDKQELAPQIESKALQELDMQEYQLLLTEKQWSVVYHAMNHMLQCYTPAKGAFHLSTENWKEEAESSLFTNKEDEKERFMSILKGAQELYLFDAKAIFHQLSMDYKLTQDLPIQDLQLLFYLLYPNLKSYSIEEFQVRFHSFGELSPCEIVFRAWNKLVEEAEKNQLYKLYQEVELPLLRVLYAMEKQGIKVSKNELMSLKTLLEEQLKSLQSTIFTQSETEFNLASPKQLAFILFEKLHLPVIKKTKTGASTDSEVLDTLEALHPVVANVKKYRELSKLLSTYVLAFLNKLDHKQMLHTTYLQAGPSTGRISSVDPNLQNIPSDSDSVYSIKSVFMPSQENCVFVSADYSQIDLRVLAHFSEDPQLMDAFFKEEDIHAQTARLIFHLPKDHPVSESERKIAKTINFGIIYGMSSYGLSRALKISEKEASMMIEKYFKSYPGVSLFKEATIARVKAKGYAETIISRKRSIPELASHNKQLQQLGERLAFNTIIQGSSADVIKVAMVQMHHKLKGKARIHMLLQVHDELIWECHQEELDNLCKLIPQVMEHSIQLKVPLKVHIKTGSKLSMLRPYHA
jgi:DNA polymerase I